MGQSVIRNPRKIHSQSGGDPSLPTRVTNLENNEYKVTYYEIISGASGSITIPTGATINAGEFGLSGNCILSKIDGSNKPTFESPTTSGGTIVTASLNETTGAWIASGTYTDTNVALIYSIKIKAVYYSNLNYNNIIETAEINNNVQLGLIQIVDKAGDFFTDLASATTYIEQYFNPAIITDKSFNNGIFYFTVPDSTSTENVAVGFLSASDGISPNSASFVDEFGLVSFFLSASNFERNSGYHIMGNVYFQVGDFNEFSGIAQIQNISGISAALNYFGLNSTGKFIIEGNLGSSEAANFGATFFSGSTATIFANASKYTSNAGGIQGDLVTAITNGCNVQFDGIDLEQTANKQNSLTVDGTGVKYPTVDAVNTKGSIQNYYSGKCVTIPFAGTSSAINGWNGAIIYIPIPITSSVAFTNISQEVTALAVGSNIRLALYTSVNGLPSALLEDSGNLSTATIGIKNYVLSAPHSFTAVDKQVFVAIQSSSAGVGLRYALNSVCFNYFNGSGQSGGLFNQVQVFGAFPATATPSVYANANSPLVSLLVQ